MLPHVFTDTMKRVTTRGSWLVALGLVSGTGLASCRAEPDHLEWTVHNDTADTLQVAVRYPLDSTWLATPDQLARVRQDWVADSSSDKGHGFYASPLSRLVCHHGRWYFVYSRYPGVNGYFTGMPQYTQLTPAQGRLTYTLAPDQTQLVLTMPYIVGQNEPQAYLSGLWLEQGARRQQVLPARSVADVFVWETTDRTHAAYNLYHLQLTVGPGLTLNRGWLGRWWDCLVASRHK